MTNSALENALTSPYLNRDFFAQETLKVARALIGKVLVVGAQAVIIAETEAYIGTTDLAAHSRFGKTPRNSVMWEQAGHLYIFLVYGMHLCLNIVTEQTGSPAAVLIRGGVPMTNTNGPKRFDGPGKLTRALGITKNHNGVDITKEAEISVRDLGLAPKVITTPRIGVDYAGSWATKPWRFVAQLTSKELEEFAVNQASPIYMHRTAPTPSQSHGSRTAVGRLRRLSGR